jgi:hypothetical protein
VAKIKVNKAKCLCCGTVIESKTVHDFQTCECGALSVDGGREYLKRGWDSSKNGGWTDLSEFEEVGK